MDNRWRQAVLIIVVVGGIASACSFNQAEDKLAMPTSLEYPDLQDKVLSEVQEPSLDASAAPSSAPQASTEATSSQSPTPTSIPTSTPPIPTSVKLHVPLILQNPELYNGCEVTSLAMLLQSAGVDVDKLTLAQAIKKDPAPRVEGDDDQVLSWGNPDIGFVGSITGDHYGYGVYHEPIVELAEQYLPDRIVDLTGSQWQRVEDYLNMGSPVWVIANSTFDELADDDFETWDTATGSIRATMKEHSVLVIGYDEDFIYINDPLGIADQTEKDAFVRAWHQMGSQAISYDARTPIDQITTETPS
ncbi:C39 family peptidase [Paenibacillus sp. N1-5-1-14]|uniref:C39 family peptidase n=1 Tax=Paenibacillus radicibacter TaxID=2972488 RepID=UPI002159B26A|nr:C39 family peptidase [Paenibacillus radicibacter]MCR8642461.1 C39 family peptidase [Paenibacillus radicibacter]